MLVRGAGDGGCEECPGELAAQGDTQPPVGRPSPTWVVPPRAADLKEGPCGDVFSHAFRCFIKSDHPDKGMDCIPQFKAFQVVAWVVMPMIGTMGKRI